jgi:hypothetical protein
MGILYGVEPLTAKLKKLLAEDGITCPEGVLGRLATPREIRAAVTEVDEFIVEFNGEDNFDQVDIHSHDEANGPWTLLNISKRGSIDEPTGFYFEKGWVEAILPVMIRLARITGPWVLIADSGEPPLVITADKSLTSLLTEWEHAANSLDAEE